MGTMASQITSLTIVYSTVYSGADQRKHQSSVSLAFVRVIHRGQVNSPHNWPVTRKMFPFDDVIMDEPLASCVVIHIFYRQLVCKFDIEGEIFLSVFAFILVFIHYPTFMVFSHWVLCTVIFHRRSLYSFLLDHPPFGGIPCNLEYWFTAASS